MSILGYAARRKHARRDRLKYATIPAPVGGINSVSPGASMPQTDCVACWNVLGGEYGLRSRLGWREWVTGLDGQVRTMMSFSGSTTANDRRYACTETGIWDVTSSTATPTQVVTFGTQNATSGWGQSAVMVTLAGHFLLYTDEANGLYVYTESTTTWAKVTMGSGGTQIAGVDPANLVSVALWKRRVWLTERGTAKAWYLDIDAVYGTANAWNFGSRFQRGGDLRGVWNWTVNGGLGIDDFLVAVSGGGDVVIYQGTDPASASTFAIRGVWYVPGVPPGRRLATDYGGDLLILSSAGIVEASKLVGGMSAVDKQQYSTVKVANQFNQMMAATGGMTGWGMAIHPSDAALLVLSPVATGQPTQPLVMSLATKGWSRYRDIPIGVAACSSGQDLYFGTEDGRVCVQAGEIDGVLLADPNAYTQIDCSFQTAFSALGMPKLKRLREITISVLSQGGSVPVTAEARYGYDFTEATIPPNTSGGISGTWDVGTWGTAVWGGAYSPQRLAFGAAGLGSEFGVAVRFLAKSRTVITDIGVGFDVGSML